MADTESSGLGNLFRELDKAHKETNIASTGYVNIVSVEPVEELSEEIIEEKVSTELSVDDQKKLEGFSNLLNAINFVEEPEPEPVDDSAKIAAFEELFQKFLEPTSESEPIVERVSVPEVEITPIPFFQDEPEPPHSAYRVQKVPEIYSTAISGSDNPYSILTDRAVEKTDNIIQDIVSTLDDMGKKTKVKEEVEQIASTTQEFDNFRTFIMQKIAGLQMSGSGSGETSLEYLDDVQRSTAKVDGKNLQYSSSAGKWVGVEAGAADDLSAGDAAINLTTTSGDITIDAAASNSDIIFKGTDGGSDITMLTLDGSDAGAASFNSTVTATGFTIGSAAIVESELETIDGITAGTVAASKAVVVDSNKDAASFRNITLTGELDAGSLDVSGNVDVDGTLEADAITVDGTTLAEYIADTAGAMVSSNTETGITVTYQDSDNTLDFVIGTLNQDTTGTAATVTTAAQTNITSLGTLTA